MKNEIRILALVLALLCTLAWLAAGRSPEAEETGEPGEAAQEPTSGQGSEKALRDGETVLRVLHGGAVEAMPMDEYLVGVLRAEMPAAFESEALKAQAIAARTYTLYKMRGGPIEAHPDADACDDISCCKAYKTAADAAADWGSMALYYEEKLARAVHDTDGEVVLYGGEPILAVFFSSSAGHTQNAAAVWQSDLPYLQSVDSPETAELVPDYYSVESFSPDEFRALFLAAHPDAELGGAAKGWIENIERSEAGFVTSLSVGGVTVRGNELRTLLGLRSPAFTVEAGDDGLTFRVTGYGHGVGMSQYGANILASQGMTAEEILEHYFTGATVGTLTS